MYIVVSEVGAAANRKPKLVNSPKDEYSLEIFRSNIELFVFEFSKIYLISVNLFIINENG